MDSRTAAGPPGRSAELAQYPTSERNSTSIRKSSEWEYPWNGRRNSLLGDINAGRLSKSLCEDIYSPKGAC